MTGYITKIDKCNNFCSILYIKKEINTVVCYKKTYYFICFSEARI